jgi:hypothetical protein
MPNKLNLQNISKITPIKITIKSINNKQIHLNSNLILPNQNTEIIIKGGTKKLSVFDTNGNVWWDGIIPSYGFLPIEIDPEQKQITYAGNKIINILKFNNKKNLSLSETNNKYFTSHEVLCILILIVISVFVYFCTTRAVR